MQLAILLVLILIAVLIAPWLIGVAIALAAAYGIYLVVAAVLAGTVLIIAVMWFQIAGGGRRKEKTRVNLTPEHQREQRRHIEAAIVARQAEQLHRNEQTARSMHVEIDGEKKACKFCQVEMAAPASRCGNCGKSTT